MTYEFANQDRDGATIGAAHSIARGRKYEYLTNSASTVFAGANLRLGNVTVAPTLRVSETQAKTAADTNTTGGGLSLGYTLPGRLQSYAAVNYTVINKVSSSKFTTADQNDGHSRAYKAGVSRPSAIASRCSPRSTTQSSTRQSHGAPPAPTPICS